MTNIEDEPNSIVPNEFRNDGPISEFLYDLAEKPSPLRPDAGLLVHRQALASGSGGPTPL